MSIAEWIEERKLLKLLNPPRYFDSESDPSKGLWTLCDRCRGILYIKHLKENNSICSSCSYHLRMSSQERLEFLLDKASWRPLDESVSPCDPLEFHDQKDYTERLKEAQERTGLQDAIQTGSGLVDGIPIAIGVMDFDFMGGSMGSVVGEKITRLIEYASQEGLTLVLVCASGGARMQEGVLSLMQMAKISAALQVYQTCANLLYISLLTSPTTGGVTASFAMLGDIIIAEPEALIAFAGRRVIEQTLCEDLPSDFQTSEYMFQHGLLDLIVPRRFLRQALSECIRFYVKAPHKKPGRIPFGVQNPISCLVEEKIRRQWGGDSPMTRRQADVSSLPLSSRTSIIETSGIDVQVESNVAQSQTNHANSESMTVIQKEHDVSTHAASSTFTANGEQDGDKTTQKADKKGEGNAFLDSSEQESVALQDTSRLSNLSEAESSTVSKTELQLKRETVEYRNILTSYQTMFDLFSKQSAVAYSLNTTQNRPPDHKLTQTNRSTNTVDRSTVLSDQLLENFMTLSEKQDVNRPEALGTAVSYPRDKHSTQHNFAGLSSQNVSNGTSTPQPTNQEKQSHTQLREQNALSKKAVSSSLKNKESIQLSPASIDFLNQSIELAATESVEWRAFYVHQKIAERTGFIEDALPYLSDYRPDEFGIAFQNTLLYRSICRSIG